jgi:hypothetical protein
MKRFATGIILSLAVSLNAQAQIAPTDETLPTSVGCVTPGCFGDYVFYTFNHPHGFGILSHVRSLTEASEFYNAVSVDMKETDELLLEFAVPVSDLTVWQAAWVNPGDVIGGGLNEVALSFDAGVTWHIVDPVAFTREVPDRGLTIGDPGDPQGGVYAPFWADVDVVALHGQAVSSILVAGDLDGEILCNGPHLGETCPLDLVGVTGAVRITGCGGGDGLAVALLLPPFVLAGRRYRRSA